MKTKARKPHRYQRGDRVRDIHTGKVYTVCCSYWQYYAGGETSDFTVLLESIEPSQPTPWNKSTNLEPLAAPEDES